MLSISSLVSLSISNRFLAFLRSFSIFKISSSRTTTISTGFIPSKRSSFLIFSGMSVASISFFIVIFSFLISASFSSIDFLRDSSTSLVELSALANSLLYCSTRLCNSSVFPSSFFSLFNSFKRILFSFVNLLLKSCSLLILFFKFSVCAFSSFTFSITFGSIPVAGGWFLADSSASLRRSDVCLISLSLC